MMFYDGRFHTHADSLKDLEEKIGYTFKKKETLIEALTHSSYANEHSCTYNERLEFLGDAVLELIISNYVFKNFKNQKEGELTNIRSKLVCEDTQYQIANKIGLGDYMRLGVGEESQGGRKRKSLLGDALEAIIGAIYLDGGIVNATEFVNKHLIGNLYDTEIISDYKSHLQQITQAYRLGIPKYTVVGESGPDHMKTFEVQVVIDGLSTARGMGKSKKAAEQDAAKNAIELLKEELQL